MGNRPKLFLDPVHGQIEYSKSDTLTKSRDKDLGFLICSLIDCKEFQRLRFIKQLGLANLVFHSAEHSRFQHSMGVAHLARRMYEIVSRNADEKIDSGSFLKTCCAALLHDIGHGPFSHAAERVFDFSHEDFTVAMIKTPKSEIYKVLAAVGKNFPDDVAAYIKPIEGEASHWSKAIVSSQLDADRFDYLLRDSLMTGMTSSRFDLGRLLEMLEHDNRGLLIHERGFHTAESYLTLLYHMYQQLYFHRTIRVAEGMLESLFRRIKDRVGGKVTHQLIQGLKVAPLIVRGRKTSLEDYLNVTEIDIWHAIARWQTNDDRVVRRLADSLMNRKLFKAIELQADDVLRFTETVAKKVLDGVKGIEKEYFFFFDEARRVTFKPYAKTEDPLEAIRIIDDNGNVEHIETRSRIVDSLMGLTNRVRWCFPPEYRADVLEHYQVFTKK